MRLYAQSIVFDHRALSASLAEVESSSWRWENEAKESAEKMARAKAERDTARHDASMAHMDAHAAGSARAKVESTLARVQNALPIAEEATLKGANQAGWNEECDEALTTIKQYIAEPPVLASPEAGETLFVYLAVSNVLMSAALFKEDENKKQRLVLFVSKSLANVKTRYNHLEQAALALQVATKKLCPYFQAHPIVVLIDLPLRSTIHKLDLSRRMARWAIELNEFDIQYKTRLAKK